MPTAAVVRGTNASTQCGSGFQIADPPAVHTWSRVTASVAPPPPSSLVAGVVLVRVIILVTVGVLLELSRNIKQPSPPPAR